MCASESDFLLDYLGTPNPTAYSIAAKSFIRKILSVAVSLVTTEFFRIGAYLENLGSLIT
jgi:hypothetical protein